MTFYERNWNCACCHAPVIYDSEKRILQCKCGIIKKYTIDPRPLRQCYKIVPSNLYDEEA